MNYVYKTHKRITQHKSKERKSHPTLNTAVDITDYKSIALAVSMQLEI